MIKRDSLFLMANLGSEVTKIISSKKRNDLVLLNEYLIQANKILKELMTLPDMKEREIEIKTLAEVITDISKAKSSLEISSVNIISYFTPFVMRLIKV
ncbi:MAG: hypothetical protein A2541_00025 [Candidatus Taylorbacteria bacterium RIFOXYD2_FULL_36_9]|uniref:Uncharacterized protein n=1 Tax=Candidatus Taylorbacteria bacterium RIFOXYD2_FULL_36_9 TaxID=1802338 RepID=A0A1G2PGS8_9BACT|nr:MAG: hypothetical protein A2541_00025 [Candidatus Taylorbacteria bacterium RIFOXYD2_FULL_36_9]